MPQSGLKTLTVPIVWATFGTFQLGANQMICCSAWWSWITPGYITVTQRQRINQWSGGIAAHPATPQKIPSSKIRWKDLASIFWDQEGVLLNHYLPKGQTIIAVYYASLLVQLKDILKEKYQLGSKVTKGVMFLHGNASARRVLTTQKKMT